MSAAGLVTACRCRSAANSPPLAAAHGAAHLVRHGSSPDGLPGEPCCSNMQHKLSSFVMTSTLWPTSATPHPSLAPACAGSGLVPAVASWILQKLAAIVLQVAILQAVCAAPPMTLLMPVLATAWPIHRPSPCSQRLAHNVLLLVQRVTAIHMRATWQQAHACSMQSHCMTVRQLRCDRRSFSPLQTKGHCRWWFLVWRSEPACSASSPVRNR